MWIQTIFGGNIGVRSIAESGFGVQLKVGNNSVIEKSHTIFSPSVSLGEHVKVGTIQTNVRQDNGIPLRSQVEFPALAMPALPFVGAAANEDSNIIVESCQVVAIQPGIYGALSVNGTIVLNPGFYSFSNVTLADSAQLVASAGNVEITIEDYLT